NPDGSPSDEGRWCFNLDWECEAADHETNHPSRPVRLRNRRSGKLAIERMLAGTLEQRIAEAKQALRPLDLSKPPPPLPFLVQDVLVEGQPCLVGGPYKALKSGLSLDLAVSLASGKPFLGTFAVPRPRKVAVFNGESGESTLHTTVLNVCRARGIE